MASMTRSPTSPRYFATATYTKWLTDCEQNVLKKTYMAMKTWVSVSFLPCLTIIEGMIMIYWIRQSELEAWIQAGNSESLKEDGVITTASERGNLRLGVLDLDLLFFVLVQNFLIDSIVDVLEETFQRPFVFKGVPECFPSFGRMRNIFWGLANDMGQRGSPKNSEPRPRYRYVDIKVGNDVIGNPSRKIFTPFSTSNKTVLRTY